jgi:hypothetical protein
MYKKRLKTREQVIIRISRHRYLQHFLLISWWDAFVYIIKFDGLFFRWIWDCWIRSAMLWHNLKHFENGQYSVREGLDCRGYVTLAGHVMQETFFNTKVNFVHFIQIFYQYIGYYIYIYIHLYLHIFISTYIYIYIHLYLHIFISTYIYIYIHLYLHIFISTYIYIYICDHCSSPIK